MTDDRLHLSLLVGADKSPFPGAAGSVSEDDATRDNSLKAERARQLEVGSVIDIATWGDILSDYNISSGTRTEDMNKCPFPHRDSPPHLD